MTAPHRAPDPSLSASAFTRLARVHALIRRNSQASEVTTLTVADLTLDLIGRVVHRGGQTIELQNREARLLEYLIRNVGRPITKTAILEHVWDYTFDPQTNVVDVLMSRLRQKVDKPFPDKLIQTLRGIGYVLQAPPA